MAWSVRAVDHYNVAVPEQPADAYDLLAALADQGVNLLAFTAVPESRASTQLALFPDEGARFVEAAKQARVPIEGPHHALLVRGDDEIGVLARIHAKLSSADIHVFSSVGVADGKGGYTYLVYVRPERFARAVEVLKESG